MAREKPTYRDNVYLLIEEGFPATATKDQTARRFGFSVPHLNKLIKEGYITCIHNKITRESVARYMSL